MPREVTKTIEDISQCKDALAWCQDMLLRGIRGGAVLIKMTRPDDSRSLDQNRKLWACLNDISRQVDWPGFDGKLVKLRPEEWKDIFSASLGNGKTVPGLDGRSFVVVGLSTRRMSKAQFSALLELIQAFGADRNVRWSDPALKIFDEYNEAVYGKKEQQ